MELKLNKPIPEDTICAISTAPGMGGIAVIRISGTNAIIITDRIFHTANKKKLSEAKPNTAHYGTIADENETPIDDVVVTLFIAPPFIYRRRYSRDILPRVDLHSTTNHQPSIASRLPPGPTGRIYP